MEPSQRIQLDLLLSAVEMSIGKLKDSLLIEGVVKDFASWSIEKDRDERLVVPHANLLTAINSFSDLDCISPVNTKDVAIYPGYIVLDRVKAEFLSIPLLVDDVNHAKKMLRLFLNDINKPKKVTLPKGPVVKLNPALFEAYPMKNPSHIFREIKLLQEPVEKIHIKWVRKQRYDKHTADSAARIALYNIDKPPAFKFSSENWRCRMEALIDTFNSMPHNIEIKRIKPAPFTPQVGMKLFGCKEWAKFHGSLPILIFAHSESVLLTSGLSNLCEAEKINSEQLAAMGWGVICSELGFYTK